MATFSDSFTRADELPLAAPWYGINGTPKYSLISNAVAYAPANGTTGTFGAVEYRGATFGAAQFAQLTIATVPASEYALGPRINGTINSPNGYYVTQKATEMRLYRVSGGSTTLLAFTTSPGDLCVNGNVLRLEHNGSGVLTVKKNDAPISSMSFVDTAPLTGGYIGMISFFPDATAVIDDFSGGDIEAQQTYLKVLVHQDAAADSSVSGVVFSAPGGTDITGAKIGEFSGATFETDLEAGQAVLKVQVSTFGGDLLSIGDSPVALVRTAIDTTGIIPCTVIQE